MSDSPTVDEIKLYENVILGDILGPPNDSDFGHFVLFY